MKLSLNLSGIYRGAKQNTSMVLLIVLVILLLLEAWTVKGSWGVLSDSKNTTLIVPAKLIRVNFNAYEAIVDRIETASNYAPDPFVSRNPFGAREKPAAVQ